MNITDIKLSFLIKYFLDLIPFLRITVQYTALAMAIGIVFGLLFAWAKLGNNRFLKGIADGYTAIMRAIPSVVLLFLVYYGLPKIFLSAFQMNLNRINKVYFVGITLGLFNIAIMSEIMKSAYLSVNRGQYEAAISNGFTAWQAIVRIVLPQAFRISIPNVDNTIITLLKEGTLGYTIGLIDCMGRANQQNALTYQNHILEIYIALAVLYWALTLLLDKGFKWIDGKMSYSSRRKIRKAFMSKEITTEITKEVTT